MPVLIDETDVGEDNSGGTEPAKGSTVAGLQKNKRQLDERKEYWMPVS